MISMTAAIIASAIISAGSVAYSADQQKKVAEEAAAKRRREADAAQAEADRIAAETKPEEEALGEIKFGAEDEFGVGGTTQEFLIPKTSALGASGRSGLGFTV